MLATDFNYILSRVTSEKRGGEIEKNAMSFELCYDVGELREQPQRRYARRWAHGASLK